MGNGCQVDAAEARGSDEWSNKIYMTDDFFDFFDKHRFISEMTPILD